MSETLDGFTIVKSKAAQTLNFEDTNFHLLWLICLIPKYLPNSYNNEFTDQLIETIVKSPRVEILQTKLELGGESLFLGF